MAFARDPEASVFVMQGNQQLAFWHYDVGTDTWATLANTPASVYDGGALAWDGGDVIYALRGGNQQGFWAYSIALGS